MRRMLTLFLALAAFAAPARAEPLIADLSESVVKITTGFTGTKVLLFGAIEGPGQVVVIVQGPRHSVVVREKQRTAGIWINRRSVRFNNVPSFYHVLSSDTLDEWLPLRTRELYEVGVEYLKLDPVGKVGPAEAVEFREALIRNMQNIGRYSRLEGNVTMLGGQLFRADLYLPANVPTGYYSIEVFLVKNGEIKSIQATPLLVTKSGIGAEVFDMAYNHPAIYGIAAIIMAVAAGLGANAIFRNI
ncbi:MAG: TIGR02186 family protein [Alphaproteobacteria bacterium]|nr:TIGR02186 family protein [Alphaproteobacteria bacterium]